MLAFFFFSLFESKGHVAQAVSSLLHSEVEPPASSTFWVDTTVPVSVVLRMPWPGAQSSTSFELTIRHTFRQSFKELLDVTCSKLEGVGMVIDSSVGVELLCRVLWQQFLK